MKSILKKGWKLYLNVNIYQALVVSLEPSDLFVLAKIWQLLILVAQSTLKQPTNNIIKLN